MRSFFLLFLLILVRLPLFPEDLTLSNEFVEVRMDDRSSAFCMKTTGGDPSYTNDDNRVILYNRLPYTSFAVIRSDGLNSIYGSADGTYSRFPYEENGKVQSEWNVHGLTVRQVLEITEGPSTGNPDTLRMSWVLMNFSGSEKQVGLQAILNPYLGNRNGIRYSTADGNILEKETVFTDDDIPDYWYAFDQIENPTVRIQGTLNHPLVLEKPWKLAFSRWDRFYDSLWDFEAEDLPMSSDQDFDSAVSVFFRERKIPDGKMMIVSTLYGLYGANVFFSENFAVSFSAPKIVTNYPFPISVNIQNKTRNPVDSLKVALALPKELTLTRKSQSGWSREFSNLAPGETVTLSYSVGLSNDLNINQEIDLGLDIRGTVNGKTSAIKPSRHIVLLNINTNLNWLNFSQAEWNLLTRFDIGSSSLNANMVALLDRSADTLKTLPKGKMVLVTGYTDNAGDFKVNQAVGKRRAEAVVNYLVQKGVPRNLFLSESRAAEKPIADNTTQEGQAKNRRVEIQLVDRTNR
jgi:hypothetical protein